MRYQNVLKYLGHNLLTRYGAAPELPYAVLVAVAMVTLHSVDVVVRLAREMD